MSLKLSQSVGVGGVNRRTDVRLIQSLLNLANFDRGGAPRLKVDGVAGDKTYDAIGRFQSKSASLARPDRRVDPNGKTFRYLTMYLTPNQEAAVASAVAGNLSPLERLIAVKKSPVAMAGLGGLNVIYSQSLSSQKHVVSDYSKQLVKIALKQAGMTHAVITSTIRTPEEQARIMLRNAKINLQDQYRLYGRNGDSVLDVYKANKSRSDKDLIDLMVEQIVSLETQNRRVSKHCVSTALYRKRNVFDIGFNSTKSANRNFYPEKFAQALKELKRDGYIETFIDETQKSNTAWHLEVRVGGKSLAKFDEGSILNPMSWVNKKAVT